jgi:hypothetical protein
MIEEKIELFFQNDIYNTAHICGYNIRSKFTPSERYKLTQCIASKLLQNPEEKELYYPLIEKKMNELCQLDPRTTHESIRLAQFEQWCWNKCVLQ